MRALFSVPTFVCSIVAYRSQALLLISMFAVNPAQHARVLCASRAAATPSLGLRPCSERTTAAGLHVQITCLCTPVRTSLCSRGATRSVSSDRCGHVRGGGSRRQLACRAAVQPAAPGQTTIGFLGIGIMGLAMARNLMKAGYKVVVWNRNPDKCAPLKAEGAEVGATPKEVAQRCDITFAMLSDPPAALEVATGPTGVAAGMSAGKGYVDVSTIDADTSRVIAAAVRGAGGMYLEAPVSGSKGPAEQGTLIFLTAGDQALFEAAAAPLDVMGKAKFFLGEVGAGAAMKLVVNMVMGSMMVAWAEGLVLAKELGLQQKDVVEVVGLGAIACPMFALKGPAMVQGNYPTAFPLKHQQKDMRLALAAADTAAQPLTVAAAANQAYIKARQLGQGDADFSAVMLAVLEQQRSSKAH